MKHRILLALALAGTYGCTGGLSCGSGSGCGANYAFPLTQDTVPNGAEFVDEGVRMRMTQDALDFLVENIRPILASVIGTDPNNPDNILLSSTSEVGGGGISLAVGESETHPTEVYIDGVALANTLSVEFVGDDAGEPDGIHIRAVDIPIGFDGRMFADFGLGNAACDIFGTNPDYGGYPFVTGLTFDATVRPRVGNGAECDLGVGECLKISVTVDDVQIGSFDSSALGSADAPTCGPFNTCGGGGFPPDLSCSGAQGDGEGPCSEDCSDSRVPIIDENGDLECDAVCTVAGLAIDFIAAIGGLLIDLLEDFLPGILESALQTALDDFDGSPIAASGRLPLSTFAPGVLPASALDLGFAVGPTVGAFDVNRPSPLPGAQGMDLIFKSGFEAAPSLVDDTPVPHPCVRHIEGADFGDLYGAFAFEVPDAEPLTGVFGGEVYSLGASLGASAMNQAFFAAYNTGALCIELSTDSVHQLTGGGGFSLSAGLIDTLAGGQLRQYTQPDAPAIIALAPSQPPILTYGEGTDVEGHLKISWPAVEVSFYVLMNERFARVFAVSTDISLQLTVFNDPATGTLRIAIVDGPNIENFVENYNELLPGVAFGTVLEQLIGVAFDALLGNGLEFNFDVGPILSDALGGAPIFVEMIGIETTPPTDRQFLNIYLGLTSTPPEPRLPPRRAIRIADDPGVLRLPEAEDLPPTTFLPTGLVRIVADDGLDEDTTEYFARADFGVWRGPLRARDGVLVVKDPKLGIVGEHTIALRARTIGDINSLVPESAAEIMKVWVDGEPPKVDVTRVGEDVVARGWDIGSALEDLRWQWQIDDGRWSDPTLASVRPLAELDGRRVAVRAIDGAGNVSKSAGLDLVVAKRRVDEEAKAQARAGGGCAQGADAAWLGALALALLAFARRLRQARAI